MHYRASVAYFPTTRDGSFDVTRLDVMDMGIPVLSHDRGELRDPSAAHTRWTIMPETSSDAVYGALEAAYRG